jgi:hypothetical protein
MPNPDPTGRGSAVALSVPAAHTEFLRRTFIAVQSGLLEDLADHSDRLRDSHRSRREADTFGRLLVAVGNGVCIPDPEMRAALGDPARSVDHANEYERVTVEHAALHGLVGQFDAARTDAPRREES